MRIAYMSGGIEIDEIFVSMNEDNRITDFFVPTYFNAYALANSIFGKSYKGDEKDFRSRDFFTSMPKPDQAYHDFVFRIAGRYGKTKDNPWIMATWQDTFPGDPKYSTWTRFTEWDMISNEKWEEFKQLCREKKVY